jgi:hypothetical protein
MREIIGTALLFAVPTFVVLCYRQYSVAACASQRGLRRYFPSAFLILITCLWAFLVLPFVFRILKLRGGELIYSVPVSLFWGGICVALLLSISFDRKPRNYALLALLSLLLVLLSSIFI